MSDTLQIITNNVPRDIVDSSQLTPAEREEFDYLDWAALERGDDSASFFRFKGHIYDLGEFMPSGVPGWDGQATESAFSGVLVRYAEDNERVIVGTYYA